MSFNFRIKKISAYGDDILEEVQNFTFPFQQLIIKEACAVMDRLEKGKDVPGLTSLACFAIDIYCRVSTFFTHMYGNELLTPESLCMANVSRNF